jgi:hypothetical protein
MTPLALSPRGSATCRVLIAVWKGLAAEGKTFLSAARVRAVHRMEERQSRGIVIVSLGPGPGRQSRRDCITQPRVARGALPWVGAPNGTPNPERVISPPRPVHPHRHAALNGPNSRTWFPSLRSIPHVIGCKRRRYNPFRVNGPRARAPRVARRAQPWAERYNPFGIAFGIGSSATRRSKLQEQTFRSGGSADFPVRTVGTRKSPPPADRNVCPTLNPSPALRQTTLSRSAPKRRSNNALRFLLSAFCFLLLTLSLPAVRAAEAPIADTSSSPFARARPIGLNEVRWTQGFWADRLELCRQKTLPGLWLIMNGTNYSQFYQNFRIAAGLAEGRHRGAPFNDGDFYKYLEAACAVLAAHPDPELAQRIEEIVGVLAKAQRPDGYLHTPTLIAQRNAASSLNSQPSTPSTTLSSSRCITWAIF